MTTDEKRQALRDAAQWLARRAGAPEDPAVLHAWQQWQLASPAHRWAWQRVEQMQSQLGQLPGGLAYRMLDQTTGAGHDLHRRTLLKGIVLLAGVGGLSWSGYRQAPVWLAEQRTAVGERRTLELADGTRLILNTRTAVDIRFSDHLRLIQLHAGEIFLHTGKDPRPLVVRSAQGDMQALGTAFNVRQYEASTALDVTEHAVAVQLRDGRQQRVEAGQALTFSHDDFGPLRATQPGEAQWVSGRLLVDAWPLRRLLDELGRYRSGYLGCSDEVADLKLSGAYPLDNLDMALAAVARVLPVEVVQRTRYWTRVVKKT